MNVLALSSILCALIVPPLAVIFGRVALRQVRRSGEQGRTTAVTGVVLGYVLSVLYAAVTTYLVVAPYSIVKTLVLLLVASLTWLSPA